MGRIRRDIIIGIKIFSGSSDSDYSNPPNPNPRRYKIVEYLYIGPFLILKVNYPDCKNFEGNKTLVYKNVTLDDLTTQGSIDPHFNNIPGYHSPIARFEPTQMGWKMAIILCEGLFDVTLD